LNEAELIYHQWIALVEIAEIFGIKFKSITESDNLEEERSLNKLTNLQMEKIIYTIYKHFTRYKLLTVNEFEKILDDIIQKEL